MKYMQAQFSLKFQPQTRIRRGVNQIEDALSEYYGPAEMTPIPDEIAPEAPRIILHSKHGHSQISFSQISVDLTVSFDDRYWEDFDATYKYIVERLRILTGLLKKINIETFCFVGISYIIHLDTENCSPVQYVADLLSLETGGKNIYEISRRITSVEEEMFFVNQQVGTFKEYQGVNIPDLMNNKNSRLTAEGASFVLDVNNRYAFQRTGTLQEIEELDDIITKIYALIGQVLKKWR